MDDLGGSPILGTPHIFSKTTGWGLLQIASQVEIWLRLNSMVYGRYNELVHGGYEPTNITGGHHSEIGISAQTIDLTPKI